MMTWSITWQAAPTVPPKYVYVEKLKQFLKSFFFFSVVHVSISWHYCDAIVYIYKYCIVRSLLTSSIISIITTFVHVVLG